MNNQDGMPTPDDLLVMMQRYSSMRIIPMDNNQKGVIVKSDTADFKKPIFFDTDCGKTFNKIKMSLKQQAFYPSTNKGQPSRLVLEGNATLVQKTCDFHNQLLGDDPYHPSKPYDNELLLMQGYDIPEYRYMDDLNS